MFFIMKQDNLKMLDFDDGPLLQAPDDTPLYISSHASAFVILSISILI